MIEPSEPQALNWVSKHTGNKLRLSEQKKSHHTVSFRNQKTFIITDKGNHMTFLKQALLKNTKVKNKRSYFPSLGKWSLDYMVRITSSRLILCCT